MSSYTYTDEHYDRLTVEPRLREPGVFISANRGGVYVSPEDVPKVAAELLKAAGVPGTFLEGELPEVTPLEGGYRVGIQYFSGALTPTAYRQAALMHLALVNFLEAREAEEAEKKAEQDAAAQRLADRRKELAVEHYKGSFDGLSDYAQSAINKIIALEDELARAAEARV